MTRPRPVATWVAATLVIMLGSACSGRPSPEAAALADVIRGAQTAELNLETVPAGYHGPGSSAESIQPVLDQVPTQLTKYYVGTLLAGKVTQHQNGIRQMAAGGGGGRIGGVKTLALRDVRVSSATATVSAEVTVWFKTAQFWNQPVSSQPAETNVIDLDLHLVRDGGTWKIDQEHSQFAPGGGP
ncbi:MAG TPA: hypothetical protein VN913_09630 [Candidatus Binatus sp.]|nr:hypothetical protein [Candidatus Binatus sp.]